KRAAGVSDDTPRSHTATPSSRLGGNMKPRWAVTAGGLVLALVGVLTLWARAPDPPPRATRAPVTASTTKPPPPSTCLARGRVAMGAGGDAPRGVSDHRAGHT